MFKNVLHNIFSALQLPHFHAVLIDDIFEGRITFSIKNNLWNSWYVNSTVENFITYAGLDLKEVMFVVQIHIVLATIKPAFTCLSELKHLLSQLTKASYHIEKHQNLLDATLTLTVTKMDIVLIKTQWLVIML